MRIGSVIEGINLVILSKKLISEILSSLALLKAAHYSTKQ